MSSIPMRPAMAPPTMAGVFLLPVPPLFVVSPPFAPSPVPPSLPSTPSFTPPASPLPDVGSGWPVPPSSVVAAGTPLLFGPGLDSVKDLNFSDSEDLLASEAEEIEASITNCGMSSMEMIVDVEKHRYMERVGEPVHIYVPHAGSVEAWLWVAG